MIVLKKSNGVGYRAFTESGTPVGEVMPLDDGYYHWWPLERGGCLSQGFLTSMASKLAELNAPWDKVVKQELEAQKRKEAMHASVTLTGSKYVPGCTEEPF